MMADFPIKQPPMDEEAEWVMSFVDDSREDRKPFDAIWEEVEMNFFVRHKDDYALGRSTSNPLASTFSDLNRRSRQGYSVLKDPETHQEVMTIVANIVLELFPDDGFMKASGVGFEDIRKGITVKRLLERLHRLPGHYWAMIEWVLSIGVFGTGIVECFWDYVEEERTLRSLEFDPFFGREIDSSIILPVPVWDDPRLQWRDHRDFFPDPSQTQIHRMLGAALRSKIIARDAKRLAFDGIYKKAATSKAVRHKQESDRRELEDKSGDETTGTHEKLPHPDFSSMTSYRYIGQVPWDASDGHQRREIVVLNGFTVRSEPWPRRIPWFEGRLTPRLGSFWGIGPGEVIRYDQDFVDTMKMMMADAVVRMTHPSPVVNKFANVDYERLRNPRPELPIRVEGNPDNAIAWPNFNPPLAPGFAMYETVKQQMRQAGGALDPVQGLGLGSKRFSATEAASTFQSAHTRPEMFAAVIRREFLPQLATYELELYQENLDPDPVELQRRVGETEIPVVLADILPQFDIEFVASLTQPQELEAMREIVAASANPLISQLIPWIPLLQRWFRKLGADEIASMVGNPQMVQLHMLLQQQAGGANAQAGNNNGTTPARPPLGALPAQIAGGVQ